MACAAAALTALAFAAVAWSQTETHSRTALHIQTSGRCCALARTGSLTIVCSGTLVTSPSS